MYQSGRIINNFALVINITILIMSEFRGEYTNKLDDKGRLIFPSTLKTQAAPISGGKYIVKKNIFQKCLEIYPLEEWKQESEMVKSKLNMFNADHNKFWTDYNRNTAEIEPDEKTGRILIPKKLLELIGVQKEVVFVGLGSTINLWAKDEYETSPMEETEFANLAQSILGQMPSV